MISIHQAKNTTMLFTTTASDEVTDMWLGDLSTTSSPQLPDSNVTRLSEEKILETLRELQIDRYHRICRPLKKHITPKTAKIICSVCVGIAIFFAWPALVIYGIDKIKISRPEGNATAKPCLIEHEYKNTPYPTIFLIILFLATVSTFVALCVLYAYVGCNIFRSRSKWTHSGSSKTYSTEESDVFRNNGEGNNKKNQARSITPVRSPKIITSPSEVRPNADGYIAVTQDANAQDSSNKDRKDSKREIFSPKPVAPDSATPRKRRFTFSVPGISADKKTTLMLFVITVVYIITFLPFFVMVTYRAMNPKFTSLGASWEAIYQLTLRSYLINSAINPIIYSFCNGVFRNECKKLFKTVLRCKTS
ncbi:hypothetical protein ScPMuIL_003946 [Solemya velum]